MINEPVKFEDATQHQKKQAGQFVKEQKERSKGIADADANDI